ncbi:MULTISPECIES: hypothetical protein [unclassified Rhodococcus (in: high G+C Gram-positive bacteria)]|uniref:Rv1733c family protein n=1 Tax=unclassified Rhodococcus (in: high G+C Gram-positive bacteria) TaxID=192944 RepID=UPI00163ACD64|nr:MULTISPECIES: hypothetical protein [unclassified Rhodococcus (in: high G+C Gram-positive bacteria)]MBC2644336.1 hypothetical protein [Rhodococcus sp. 3A]MBC2897971.1 hypothetical protein [Rhodococcus sp. 4CII]
MVGRAPGPVRWWRLQPCSRNPLMRRTDRVESVVVALVIMLVLLWVTVCAAVGTEMFTSLQQQSRALHARSRPVPAVLLIDAGSDPRAEPAVRITDTGASSWARWTVDGRAHTGQVPVQPQARAGDTITLEVGPDGERIETRGSTENAVLAVSATCGLWAVGAAAGTLTIAAVHRLLVRSRLRVWDQAWEKFAQPPR